MSDTYKIRPMQLKLLRDMIRRHNGNITEAVELFVAVYVHDEKKDIAFWTKQAEKIKEGK